VNPFAKRVGLPELMDLEDCDETKLLRTVNQFRLINRLFSAARPILTRYVLAEQQTSFSIVDVGAGGCDIMQWLVLKCRAKNIAVKVLCIDTDSRIVAFAQKACEAYPEIEICKKDVRDLVDIGRFDYVFANNFLHHF
jgi:2-polyprenyl-3-methyl-5-hydroxy-6-metoxy-1,4-benzoquinol methylase